MWEKYIEEKFPRYCKFGSVQSMIDIASTANDTIATVSEKQAVYLIKDRDEIIDMLIKVSQKLDELNPNEFNKIWYGEN